MTTSHITARPLSVQTTQLTSFDPATGEPLGQVPIASAQDVSAAVERAKRALPGWAGLSHEERAQAVGEAALPLLSREAALSELLCREMGKSLRRGRSEVRGAIAAIPHLAREAADALRSEQVHGALLEYRPLGLCAVISPWNYPLAMANNLLIPALVAGNTVILKPSEHTPLVAQAYADVLMPSLPSGVMQILHGTGEVGAALVEADVAMVAFTGSQETGRDIMRRASRGIKRLVMELGGNDPMIVMGDADLSAAARFAVASSFENSGQMCTSTERIYVDQRVARRFEALVTEIAAGYRMGPWNEPGADIFPINNEAQRRKIIEHIDDAVASGARVLLGGSDHPPRYVRPTVLADVPRTARMEREETFGPVVAMASYSDIEQAIEWANDSTYGLGAVVFGGADAAAVASRLEAGMVGINGGVGGSGVWVGAKQSGFGFHGGAYGHRQFAQVRVTS